MLLRTLGSLSLEGSSFRRPKPLLLLAYLAIEGPTDRGRLATLFWPDHDRPRQNLAVAVSQLKAGVPGALSEEAGPLVAQVECDGRDLVAAATAGDWRRAIQCHRGRFADGYPVSMGAELEEWLLATGDYLDGLLGTALIEGAHSQIEHGEMQPAMELAERAYRLYEAGIEIEPGRLETLYAALSQFGSPHAATLAREAASLGTALPPRANSTLRSQPEPATSRGLPARSTSRLVGRARELDELRTLITRPERLITVVGFSGVGKSRLALELCHETVKEGAFERVLFVPMEPVTHSGAALGHLSASVGFTVTPGSSAVPELARYLDERRTLLVLDNMEHLTALGADLEKLIALTTRLVVLITSTQPLELHDEMLYLLEGLELTSSPADPEAASCAAVTYFEERARLAAPSFSAASELDSVWRICALVGGLPLGLELAAGLIRVLSLRQLAIHLEERPEQISAVVSGLPDRHRSLFLVCEHAWAFLDDREREVLASLSVFKEEFTVAAFEAVCGPALADLARLERRSLVRRVGGRYTLHPLIRRFAAERLVDDASAEHLARDRHAEHMAVVMEGFEEQTSVGTEAEALRGAERVMPDVIAAWRWSVEQGAEHNIVRLLPLLVDVLDTRGRGPLMAELIDIALSRIGARTAVAAQLLLVKSGLAFPHDLPSVRAHRSAAWTAAKSANDALWEAITSYQLALIDYVSEADKTNPRIIKRAQSQIRAALPRLRERRRWMDVSNCYANLCMLEASTKRHVAIAGLAMRYQRRTNWPSAGVMSFDDTARYLTDVCGDHRSALSVALEGLMAELDGRARPFVLVGLHSRVAFCSLNVGNLEEAVEHNEEASRLIGARSGEPEPQYLTQDTRWVAWAAPHVVIHTGGPDAAMRFRQSDRVNNGFRDLLINLMLARGDREGARADIERWEQRGITGAAPYIQTFLRAMIERLHAVLANDSELSRRHMVSALRQCAKQLWAPLALDCIVSSHRLFPDVVSEEEAVEAATHPAAYHSAPLLLTNFNGNAPKKSTEAPYTRDEVLLRATALADRLET